MLELLSIRPPFYKFVVSKVIAVYFLGISYIAVNLLIKVLRLDGGYMANFVSAIACVSVALYLSYRLISSERNLRGFFMPSLFMLLLLMSFYVSFTPFPPHNPIFEDRNTGLYGIIPENIDFGAIVLDAFYNFD
jgi:hypothetical protein